jgi:hypothetical protein
MPLATIGGAIYGHPTGIADCISSGGRQGREPSIVIGCFVGAFSSHRRCDNLLHVSSGYPHFAVDPGVTRRSVQNRTLSGTGAVLSDDT